MKNSVHCFLTLMLAALLLAGGAGCTAKAKRAYHESRADKFYAASQFDRAEIEYLNVLRNDPDNAKAYGRLGNIYFQQGRLQTAGSYLFKASLLATNDLDLRLKLGNVYVNFGNFKEARDAAEYILARQPTNDEAVLLLVDVALTPKDIAAARTQIQALVKNGDRATCEVALATLDYREHDLDSALKSLHQALALNPKSPAALEAMGAYCASINDRTGAENNLKAAADLSGPRSAQRMMYAHFKLATGDLEAAKQILRDAIKEAPDYLPALMGMAEISLTEKKYDVAEDFAKQVLSHDADNFDGLMFESRLDMAENKNGDAMAGLERMSKLYPQASGVQCQLGLAYLTLGDDTKATLSLNRALELDPNFTEAILLLAQVQIKDRNPDPVIVSMSNLIEKFPQLEDARLLLADAYRLRDRFTDALGVYQALEQAFPKDPKLPLLTGSAFLELKKNDHARAAFERVRQLAPDNLQALTQLVELDLGETNYAAAMKRVQAEMQKRPSAIAPRLLQAQVLLAEKKSTEAESVLLQADKMDPDNSDVTLMLSQLYLNSNQNQKALAQLDAATAKNPRNLSAWMLAAAIHEQAGEHQAAADDYEKALVVDPKLSAALNNLAYQYSEFLGQLDRAYDLAQQARTLQPFDPATADTLGWIYLKRGDYPAAVSLLQEAAKKMPIPEVQYHYGMACYMSDDEADARAAFEDALQPGTAFKGQDDCRLALALMEINPQTADAAAQARLEKRVADKPNDPVALGRLAEIYERIGKTDKAITDYEAALQTDPKKVSAMIALARLYATKDPAKAMSLAKAVNLIVPDNADVTSIMGQIAYQSGDFKMAATWFQQTIKNQPDNAQTQFEYAQAAYNIGNVPDAKTALQRALSLDLPAPASTEGKRMLQMIGVMENAAPAAASQQVAEILKTSPDYIPAIMARATLELQRSDLAAAAADGEKILARLPDFVPAQRLLAIVYSNDPAKAAKAYELAMKARDGYPNDVALAKAIGIIVFQQGDYSRAARLLTASAASSSADADTYYYLGSAQFQLKEAAAKSNLQKALSLKLSGTNADNVKKMLSGLK